VIDADVRRDERLRDESLRNQDGVLSGRVVSSSARPMLIVNRFASCRLERSMPSSVETSGCATNHCAIKMARSAVESSRVRMHPNFFECLKTFFDFLCDSSGQRESWE
jgi:hypothetical protein